MAIQGPWTNAQVIINGVDLSNHIVSAEVDMQKADQETTAMGAYGKSRRPGLADEQFKFQLRQDQAAASVAATLDAIYLNGTAVSVEVRQVNAARSATNPAYIANACYLLQDTPLQGAVGDVLNTDVVFVVDGQTNGIQKLTS